MSQPWIGSEASTDALTWLAPEILVPFTNGVSTISINGSGTLQVTKEFINGVSTIGINGSGTFEPDSLNSISFTNGVSTIGINGSGALTVTNYQLMGIGISTITFDSTAELTVESLLFDIELNTPANDERVVTVSPTLTLTITQTEPANTLANVQVQLSASSDFSTTSVLDYSFDTTSVYGAQETIPLTVQLLDGVTYYWRARIERDDETYDPWTVAASFVVDLSIGDTAEYVLWGNVVATGEVVPHLWYVADPRVYSHASDTITIVGMGFGDKTITSVKFGDVALNIVDSPPFSQEVVPADDDGLSEARIISSLGNDVNVEHDIIVVPIADDIEGPGGSVSVETGD